MRSTAFALATLAVFGGYAEPEIPDLLVSGGLVYDGSGGEIVRGGGPGAAASDRALESST